MKPTRFAPLNVGLIILMVTLSPFIHAQLSVNNTVNATDGVQDVLLGGGITATNISFQGYDEQVGSFNCNGCGLGIGYGVVIGTGNVDGAEGPNDEGGLMLGPPDMIDAVGDPDLAELSGMDLNNTAVLEFDFVPTGDSLFFNYVFSSEEYPEWVGSINDAFGFFLSGPGLSGPFTNNAESIALIPGTTIPITINNVNDGDNSGYYVDNDFGGYNIQADGFTVVLTAIAEVVCGSTYHIKMTIGDASDNLYDSWVFLEAGSFQSNQLSATYLPPNLAPSVNGIYEGCDPAQVTFTRSGALDVEMTYDVVISGTAQNGVDYETIASEITFEAGESEVSIPLVAVQDGTLEGNETLNITVIDNACGNSSNTSVDIVLSDLPALQVTMPDVTINCGQQAVMTPTVSGGLGNYSISWETNYEGLSLSTYPSGPTSYDFTVTDTCGVTPFSGIANVLFVANPALTVNIGADITATCQDEISITPVVNGGFGTYDFIWSVDGSQVSTQQNASFYDSEDLQLELEVTDDCGVSTTDVLSVTYPPTPISAELGNDLTVTCVEENLIEPVISGGVGDYTYTWSTQDGVIGSADQLLFQTEQTEEVVLTVEDECGNSTTDMITFTVPSLALAVDIGQDMVVQCIDDVNLDGTVAGGVGNYSYTWMVNGNVAGSQPTLSDQFYDDSVVELIVNDECGNSSSDEVNISVPPVAITAGAGNDITATCLDISPLNGVASGGVGNYTYSWSGPAGVFAGNSASQFIAPENVTITLTVTDECGNSDSDQLEIHIPAVPILTSISSDTTICINEYVQIQAAAQGGIGDLSYSWTGLEYQSEVIDVAPSESTTYTFNVHDQCGNEASTTTTVRVTQVHPNFMAEYIDEFTVAFTNLTPDAVFYVWEFSDGEVSNEINPVHTFTSIEDWTVTLNAYADAGCKKTLEQVYHPTGALFVPNTFTPDKDGLNDFFFVYGHDIKSYKISIFNKYGEMIYASDDINLPWDGSVRNGDYYAPDGAYPFRITAVDERDNLIERSGSVIILR